MAITPIRRHSVAGQILILHLIALTFCSLATAAALIWIVQQVANDRAEHQALAVAETFASAPETIAGLRSADPASVLQPIAEAARRRTGVDFLVAMSPSGVRYSHPDPAMIHRRFIGHIEPATQGRAFTETYTGTLGPSIRAVVPAVAPNGSIVGLVAAGITTKAMDRARRHQIIAVLVGVIALAFLSLVFAVALSSRVRRQTHGLHPDDITRLFHHHDAVLHGASEGLLIMDGASRLLLINDEAKRLLAVPDATEGWRLDQLGLDPAIVDLCSTDRRSNSEAVLSVQDKALAVSARSTRDNGRDICVVGIRDITALRELAGELDAARELAAALHAQTHEASNRIHTLVTLVQLEQYRQAIDFAADVLPRSEQMADQLLRAIADPALVALLLRKSAQAHEQGIEFTVTDDTAFGDFDVRPTELITVVGNLLDNALEAVGPQWDRTAKVTVTVRADQRTCLVRVADTGPGLHPENVADAFSRGWTSKSSTANCAAGRGIGLSLVQEVVERYAGTVTVEVGRETVVLVRLHSRQPESPLDSPMPLPAPPLPPTVRSLSDAF